MRGESFSGVAPIAVVNEAFVRQFLAGENPLGNTLREGSCAGHERTIIGVVADTADQQRFQVTPMVYVPYNPRMSTHPTTFALRTGGNPSSIFPSFRRVIAELGVNVKTDVQTGMDYKYRTTKREHVLAGMLLVLGGLALFISCMGLYMGNAGVRSQLPDVRDRSSHGAVVPKHQTSSA